MARRGPELHLDAVTLVTTVHLHGRCEPAVALARRRCPLALPKGPGGAPIVYRDASLLLIALLRTLWRLSYRDMHDWLVAWPALADARGLPTDAHVRPRVPCASHRWKRGASAGAPPCRTAIVATMPSLAQSASVSGVGVSSTNTVLRKASAAATSAGSISR
jgi:hypothetical protein